MEDLNYRHEDFDENFTAPFQEKSVRNDYPIFTGFLQYFPLAALEISKVSKICNDQHNKGQKMHWDKTKSIGTGDQAVRHLINHGQGIKYDTDGARHLGKFAWRACELLERELMREQKQNEQTN